MKNILSVSSTIFLAMAVLSSCDGSSGVSSGGTCANTPGCGGDIVGTWTITSSCLTATPSMIGFSCPTATIDNVNLKISGTLTFNADMTYTSTSTLSGSETVNVPASCLTNGGAMTTCSPITQSLAGNPNLKSATCMDRSGCSCTFVLLDSPLTEVGTYTITAAGLLTRNATGNAPSQSDYCVKGKTLTDSPHMGVAMMRQSPISGTIMLTKS